MDRHELAFADMEELRRVYDDSLRHRRVVLPAPVRCELLAECELVLVHPLTGATLHIPARAVAFQDDPPAACLELATAEGLSEFVSAAAESVDATAAELDGGPNEPATSPPRPAETTEEKLRRLPPQEQRKLARGGELAQRVVLERLFGKSVWEALLHNPRLTIPEVARIARKGTLPRPLLDQIVDNATWVKAGPVRRALLSNPRLSPAHVLRVLQLAPKSELRLVEKQLGYPTAVRQAARKLLSGAP
jgi:hypothetical protein